MHHVCCIDPVDIVCIILRRKRCLLVITAACGMSRSNGLTLQRIHDRVNPITRLAGQVKVIREHRAKDFRKRIGEFVDSNNYSEQPQVGFRNVASLR